MLNNMSAADRQNYNKMIGNLNTLIQGCDKLLGSIVEKVHKLGSTDFGSIGALLAPPGP